MNIKFEVGKFYRRRDGEKVKLVHFTEDGNLLFVMKDRLVLWRYADGRASMKEETLYDIIGEWSDKEIVEILIKVEVDENAKYVAVDLSGFVYQYSTKPKPMAATFRLENDRDTQKQVNIINWRETLTEVT